jgi:hypothetical protein
MADADFLGQLTPFFGFQDESTYVEAVIVLGQLRTHRSFISDSSERYANWTFFLHQGHGEYYGFLRRARLC